MAFFDEKDEEQSVVNGGPVQTSAPSAVVGSSGSVGGGTGAQQSAQKLTPDNPGNFVGIQKYLEANKRQASGLADQAASVIGKSVDTAKQSVQGLKGEFDQAFYKPQGVDQNVISKLSQTPESLNDQERQSLKSSYNLKYTGPQSVYDNQFGDQVSKATKDINTAVTNVNSSNTDAGRKSLISQINKDPRTKGATSFDNILLSAGGGREKIAQATRANQNINPDMISAVDQEARAKAKAATDYADSIRNQTQGAVAQKKSQIQEQINNALNLAREKYLKDRNAIESDIQDLNLDQSTLDTLGLQDDTLTYGANLKDYFKAADINDFTKSRVATPEDYARLKALSEISGEDMDAELTDQTKASSLPKSFSFDKDAFLKEVQSRQDNIKDLSAADSLKEANNAAKNAGFGGLTEVITTVDESGNGVSRRKNIGDSVEKTFTDLNIKDYNPENTNIAYLKEMERRLSDIVKNPSAAAPEKPMSMVEYQELRNTTPPEQREALRQKYNQQVKDYNSYIPRDAEVVKKAEKALNYISELKQGSEKRSFGPNYRIKKNK